MLCDPDYINQKLYDWFEYRERLSYEHRRTYTAAATYEEFMKMIELCHDIEHLKQMRCVLVDLAGLLFNVCRLSLKQAMELV